MFCNMKIFTVLIIEARNCINSGNYYACAAFSLFQVGAVCQSALCWTGAELQQV